MVQSNKLLSFYPAHDKDKYFFWKAYKDAMGAHIEQIWGWNEDWQLKDFSTRWQQCDNQLICSGGQPIGYVQTKDSEQEHYLMMFIVLPAFRGAGVGEQVLNMLRKNTNKPQFGLRVFRSNTRALQLYIRLGLSIVTEEDDFYYLQQQLC